MENLITKILADAAGGGRGGAMSTPATSAPAQRRPRSGSDTAAAPRWGARAWLTVLAVVAAATAVWWSGAAPEPPPPPPPELQRWWGAGPPPSAAAASTPADTAVRLIQLRFSEEMIADLKQRLQRRRQFVQPLEGMGAQYGINTQYLQEVLRAWHDRYDFKARERNLNRFPHYVTRLHGLDIHFVHVKPQIPTGRKLEVLPILLLHGWPSSSQEFLQVIPHLTAPHPDHDFVFEVVAPDLPGFGFSEGTTKAGLNPMEMGVMMRNLMRRLGHERYYVQGGDWGSQCATHVATLFPREVLGVHLNLPLSSRRLSALKLLAGALAPRLAAGPQHARIYPLRELLEYVLRETGYFHLQATKPDTIGIGLSDSPAALAGYILEKIGVVTNREQLHERHGGVGDAYRRDDLLDLLTINWANGCITTSMRLYAEATGPMHDPNARAILGMPTPVPMAAINFKYEILYQPDWVIRDKFPNLVHSTTLDYGGHFPGLQHPEVLARDLWSAARAFIQFNSQRATESRQA